MTRFIAASVVLGVKKQLKTKEIKEKEEKLLAIILWLCYY